MSTQNDNTVSFIEFLRSHDIQIPVIQRDYVQGRALTDKETEKRNDFVEKLMDALLPEGNPCHLDFIYGGRESYGDGEVNSDAPFLPLDGQQRLTTLFLLHWVLLQKNAPPTEEQIFRERMNELSKFTYKTRISSGRFCQKLTELHAEPDRSLISQIEKKYWYDHDMQSDPTVKAMMQMLEFMERMLDSKYCSHKQEMLENLYDTSKHCITFDELDMKQYNLTDGLYVKMNARGKELTAFENWKASFTDMIECNEEKERFSYSMEHEWNDVFWRIAYQDYLDIKEKLGEQVPYPKIDEAFMNFFNNITRLLFFKENKSLDANDYKPGLWSTVSSVYKDNKESRGTLFNMLDTLHEIDTANDSAQQFFGDIFTTDAEDVCKVRLFDDNIDLFEAACSTDKFSVNHILLFAILSYCSKHKTFTVNEQLRNYVRFCRNYLEEHNYFNLADVTISTQVRVSDMAQYTRFFEALLLDPDPLVSLKELTLKDDYALREKSKLAYYNNPKVKELIWKLEDLPLTHGNLSAFDSVLEKCKADDTYCTKVWNAVDAFIQAPSLTKVQLFIALGYKGIEVRNCAYGKAVFFGSEFKGKSWMVHFRKKYDSSSPLNSWMETYVEAFSQVNDLDTIVTQQIPADKRSVKYYMLKYPDVLASQVYRRKDHNFAPFYFAMKKPWENLDMISIHSFSNRPLNQAYQVCPMANAVARKVDKFEKYHNENRVGNIAQFAYKNGNIINEFPGGWDNIIFEMKFGEWEWLLPQETYNQLSPSLQKELKPGQDNYYELHQTEDKDLVEVAVDFMNKVIEDFEQRGLL